MANISYLDLKAQIEKLTKQAEVARAQEIQGVVQQIHNTMAEYGITGADLGIKGDREKLKTRSAQVKFQDPDTGSTWTGRGRAPAWIVGKDRSKYLV